MNPNNAELERGSNSSTESLSPPFRSIHVSFTAGSTDSLSSDTQTGSDGSKWPSGCQRGNIRPWEEITPSRVPLLGWHLQSKGHRAPITLSSHQPSVCRLSPFCLLMHLR